MSSLSQVIRSSQKNIWAHQSATMAECKELIMNVELVPDCYVADVRSPRSVFTLSAWYYTPCSIIMLRVRVTPCTLFRRSGDLGAVKQVVVKHCTFTFYTVGPVQTSNWTRTGAEPTLFLLIFRGIKFREFCILEKIVKISTREKKRARKLNMRNFIPEYVRKTILGF